VRSDDRVAPAAVSEYALVVSVAYPEAAAGFAHSKSP
jgi:hypothetical protein